MCSKLKSKILLSECPKSQVNPELSWISFGPYFTNIFNHPPSILQTCIIGNALVGLQLIYDFSTEFEQIKNLQVLSEKMWLKQQVAASIQTAWSPMGPTTHSLPSLVQLQSVPGA